MRAKPSSVPELFALALVLFACRGSSPDSTAPDAGGAPMPVSRGPSSSTFPTLAGDPARIALAAKATLADRLRARAVRPDDPDYLRIRRALAAGAPLWRRREMLVGEVIFGPLRSVDEAGGAISRLDAALVERNATAALAELEMIAAPLRLLAETSKQVSFLKSTLAPEMSAAAYELGSLALESTPGVPDGLPAVIADCQGTLDFIENGAKLIAADHPEKVAASYARVVDLVSSLRKRLDDAASKSSFDDRASFVLLTGKLGNALGSFAGSAGMGVTLPYRARHPSATNGAGEFISALTVPAARTQFYGETTYRAYVELGRVLFFDKRLSAGKARSCASCHIPEKGLADGTARPKSLEPTVTLRHTPSLLYGSLQAAYLWDGRVLTAERQALGVIHAKAEMGLSDTDMIQVLQQADDLRPFLAALSTAVTPDVVGRALASFQAEMFVPANAPIDRFARGEDGALSSDARAGLDVFVGKGRCARCHIPPFFGGSRPRDFATPVFAVLGVPTAPGSTSIDPDRGRAAITNRPADEHAFKTPTVRNVIRTAPYFHHGGFKTLEQVIDFYDQGGGRGLGLSVPNQDPDVRKLSLSAQDKRVLLEFLQTALLDATPPEQLAPGRTPAR